MNEPARAAYRWQDDAACQDYPAEWWDPDEDTGRFNHANQRAMNICEMCAVRAECSVFGEDEEYGIWGGVVRTRKARQQRLVSADAVRAALRSLPAHVTHPMVIAELEDRGFVLSRRKLTRFRSGATTKLEVSEADAILAVVELLRLVPAPVTQADAYRSGKTRKGSSR